MTDILTSDERSARMRLVKSKNTKPEIVVRQLCRSLGYSGYRLHRKELPGKPDIVFIGRKLAIFVHGCFWHGHECAGHMRLPKSRREYWLPKIMRNAERDANNVDALVKKGWNVLVIWECETKNPQSLIKKLQKFLGGLG